MKTRRRFKLGLFLFACLFVITLTSCNACSSAAYANSYEADKAANKTEATNQIVWVVEQLDLAKKEVQDEITSAEAELTELNNNISDKETEIENELDEIKKAELERQLVVLQDQKVQKENEKNNLSSPEYMLNKVKEAGKSLMETYANYGVISGKKKEKDIDQNYKVIFIRHDVEVYKEYVNSATTADSTNMTNFDKAIEVKSSCFSAQTNTAAEDKVKGAALVTDVYELVAIFTLQVKLRTLENEPLHFYADSFGDFMAHLFNNLLVFPVGWLLYTLSKVFFGQYIIGLFLTTLIVRTLGWPIYAKTNDMSLKMKAIEPEIAKIQKRYENRKDPDSQRMMQMEQARLYKQNGIGLGGCLMPFLQFPIFMAIFRAISRIPDTIAVEGTKYTLNWAADEGFNSKFLGLDLFKDYTVGTTQLIWIIILVILVSGTQFLSQWISEKRQQNAKDKAQEDIPAYRRQAAQQQANDTQRTMKTVMYMMIFMMAVFVWTSKAGLGIYWLIGNVYSMVQMYINSKQSEKKLEKLKERQRYR